MNPYTKDSVASDMFEVSLDYCREKMRVRGRGQEMLCLLKGNDANVLEYFRYSMAMQVGSYLGKSSDTVQEVYICPDFDYLDEDPILTLPLVLIVHVKKKTAALEAVAEALQSNLLEEYRNLFSPVTDKLNVYLQIFFVDESEMQERKGMASCIGSFFKPALRAWSR